MADKPTVPTFAANSTFTAAKADELADNLAEAIKGCLGRGGTSESPNSMEGNLDMDLHRIQNLADAVNDADAVTYRQMLDNRVAIATVERGTIALQFLLAGESSLGGNLRTFDLQTALPGGFNSLNVFLNGVFQEPMYSYVIDSNLLVFESPLSPDDRITLIYGALSPSPLPVTVSGIVGPPGPPGADGDDGPQGIQGEPAPFVEFEYSVDGATLWHSTFQTGDLYFRQSPDGGLSWSNSMPVGEQGPVGPQGPQGEQGPQGPQGEQGPAGLDGADGADGAPAPYTQIRYSGDDGATWHSTFQTGDTLYQQSTDGGVTWSNSIPIGMGGSIDDDTYTQATLNQTVFTVSEYEVGVSRLLVSVNGVLQQRGTAYTETSTTSITFSEGLAAGDSVAVRKVY